MHFVRHAGNCVHHLVPHRTNESRRRATTLRNHRGTDRNLRLTKVVGRHASTTRGKHLDDGLRNFLVVAKFDSHHRRDGVAREIVVGRAQSAAHDDRIGVIEASPQLFDDAIDIVAHLHLNVAGDAVGCELFTDPRGIRVDDLTEQQLGTHGKNVTTHCRLTAGDRGELAMSIGANRILSPADEGKNHREPEQDLPGPVGIGHRDGYERETDGELLTERFDFGHLAGGNGNALRPNEHPVHADQNLASRNDDDRKKRKQTTADKREHRAKDEHLVGERIEESS